MAKNKQNKQNSGNGNNVPRSIIMLPAFNFFAVYGEVIRTATVIVYTWQDAATGSMVIVCPTGSYIFPLRLQTTGLWRIHYRVESNGDLIRAYSDLSADQFPAETAVAGAASVTGQNIDIDEWLMGETVVVPEMPKSSIPARLPLCQHCGNAKHHIGGDDYLCLTCDVPDHGAPAAPVALPDDMIDSTISYTAEEMAKLYEFAAKNQQQTADQKFLHQSVRDEARELARQYRDEAKRIRAVAKAAKEERRSSEGLAASFEALIPRGFRPPTGPRIRRSNKGAVITITNPFATVRKLFGGKNGKNNGHQKGQQKGQPDYRGEDMDLSELG